MTTPLKGISSTRSTTRAINALKFETSASKSPTPSLRSCSVQDPVSNLTDLISNSDEEDEECDESSVKDKFVIKSKRLHNKG